MKKLLLILGSFILLVLIAAIVLPFLYKDKILALIKETANEQVNARINFSDDISLSLFSHFPDFTLGVKNVSVAGIDAFDGDTLFAVEEFTATLDIMSAIKGEQIKVNAIILEKPRIHAIVLEDGKANWDITKPSVDATAPETPDTTATKFNIALKRLEVNHAFIAYQDKQGNITATLNDFTHLMKGDFSESLFDFSTENVCEQLTVSYGGINYLNGVKMTINAAIAADMTAMKFTLKENTATLNNLSLGLQGWIAMPTDDITMDISYRADQAEFKNFLSLIPAIYAKDFSSIESSGKLGFSGTAKGTYNDKQLPAFDFNLVVENGRFKYPELPAPVEQVAVALKVSNTDGDLNHTVVDLSKLHFSVNGDAFDAKLKASDLMKDPLIDASFKGTVNLGNVTRIVPLEQGTSVSGTIQMNLIANGRVSTVEQQQYEAFNASGAVDMKQVKYSSKDLKQPFELTNARIEFSPKLVKLADFTAQIGNSDFSMTGELSNFFAYALGKGTISGLLNVQAKKIDANEFLSGDEQPQQTTEVADTSQLIAPEIPSNIKFTLNCQIGQLFYSNMEMSNFKGQVAVADQKIAFNHVSLNTLGSTMTMDGFYEAANPKKPSVSMDFGINNLDIQKAFVTFNTIKRMAPIAENTQGTFSTRLNFVSPMDQHLNPIYDGLFATGSLDIPKAVVKDVKAINQVAEVLKSERLKNPAITNVHLKFKIEKGRVYTQPFDITMAGQKVTLSGSTGLDQTIDYTGKTAIPRSALGSANSALNDALAKANNKAGTNLKMNETINAGFVIGGTFTKPTVSTNLADIAKSEANSLKTQLAAEADRKKKELEAHAKAEADKLKKDAEAKLKAETDRLKKEAEDKAKAEKEKAKKQLQDEAKKQLKGLFGK